MSKTELSPEVIKQVEHDYYAGALTKEQIVKKYADSGLTAKILSRLAEVHGWTDLRVQSAKAVQKKVSGIVAEVVEGVIVDNEVNVVDFIISEFHLNKGHYELYDGVAEVLKDMIKKKAQTMVKRDGTEYTIPLCLDDYKTIVDIIAKIQGGQRLSIGLKDKKDEKGGNQYNNINLFGDMQAEIRQKVLEGASTSLLEIQKMVEDNLSE